MSGGGNVAVSRRLTFVAAAAAIGAAMLALALVFLAFAFYLALLERLAPWQAALVVAGGALAIAAILFILAYRSSRRTVDQIQLAVRSNALAVAAPVVLRLLARNARLAASVAALAGTALALLRVLRRGAKEQG